MNTGLSDHNENFSNVETSNSVKLLRELLRQPGNFTCADCNREKPLWANIELGILICYQCSKLHRSLINSATVIQLSCETASKYHHEINDLLSRGNTQCKAEYEAFVPHGYWRPSQQDPIVLHEQWILDKYVRRLFRKPEEPSSIANSISTLQRQQTNDSKICKQVFPVEVSGYFSDFKIGYLWKRGKKSSTFNRRLFILDDKENTLRYYRQIKNPTEPKGTLRLNDINIVVAPEKVGHQFGFQITNDVDGSTRRNLFVYAQTGKELVEWLSCIRWLKYKRLPDEVRKRPPLEVGDMLMHYFVKEGWVYKTGPNAGDVFRKRWFTLDRQTIYYSKHPLDAFPNSITLGSSRAGYAVINQSLAGYPSPPRNCCQCFTLVTPTRIYPFTVESAVDRDDWIRWLNVVIETASNNADSSE